MAHSEYHEPPEGMRMKEAGSTTLKQCGWCEHASGSHRYNYCIHGTCSLQKSYSNKVRWDDECHFIKASESELNAFIDHKIYEIKNAERRIKQCSKYIAILEGMKHAASKRPPIPQDRKHDHFNEGDRVAVYHKNKWWFGDYKVGYRHHDGCVSYRLDGIGPQKGGYWGCGASVPIAMLETEYKYFKDNPGEYKEWCRRAYEKDYNGKKLEVSPL